MSDEFWKSYKECCRKVRKDEKADMLAKARSLEDEARDTIAYYGVTVEIRRFRIWDHWMFSDFKGRLMDFWPTTNLVMPAPSILKGQKKMRVKSCKAAIDLAIACGRQ